MEKFQIIDLDGCIADDRWRRYLIRPLAPGEPPNAERFHAYHREADIDNILNRQEIFPDVAIIILTGRNLRYFRITMDWLNKHSIQPHAIIMRNNDDHRPSVDVKRTQVQWLQAHYSVNLDDVVQAIDDRDDIVEMYRTEYRLPARVVRIGEEPSL